MYVQYEKHRRKVLGPVNILTHTHTHTSACEQTTERTRVHTYTGTYGRGDRRNSDLTDIIPELRPAVRRLAYKHSARGLSANSLVNADGAVPYHDALVSQRAARGHTPPQARGPRQRSDSLALV